VANVRASGDESFESLLRRFNKRVQQEGCNKMASYLRYAVANSMRSLALSASERKQPRDARPLEVLEVQEDSR